MIDLIPNSTSFRRIPYQSGNYSIELGINLANHNNNVDFALSGGGSIFFRFGSNSGNYYASGIQKLYFDSTIPNSDLDYTFVVSTSGYDVYDASSSPLILGGIKNSGRLERIYTTASSAASGQYSLILRGARPDFYITSGMTFPTQSNFNDAITVQNTTSVPFYLLSGAFDPLNFLSGANRFPTLVDANSTASIPFSGKTNLASNQSISFILNTDFFNTVNVLTISGTTFSGSGYNITVPESQTANFESFSDALWYIANTGTTILNFHPVIDKIVSGILISPPTYSGTNLKNNFSGYFDTPSSFYMSDKITWTGGAFHIIQENNTGINIFNITGGSPTGLSIGTNTNLSVGETFVIPFDFQLTGVSVKMATNSSGFISSDIVYVNVFKGNGVSGQRLSVSDSVLCSNIPFSTESGVYFDLRFPSPIDIIANNRYTFALSGNPEFIGNVISSPTRAIFMLQTTGVAYNGSGFYYDGPTTTFTSGNGFFRLDWMPAINSHRYQINIVSGDVNNFYSTYSGTYDKYQTQHSFVFDNGTKTIFPNESINFEMTYTGLVSGVNFAQLSFPELGYSTIISGETL